MSGELAISAVSIWYSRRHPEGPVWAAAQVGEEWVPVKNLDIGQELLRMNPRGVFGEAIDALRVRRTTVTLSDGGEPPLIGRVHAELVDELPMEVPAP